MSYSVYEASAQMKCMQVNNGNSYERKLQVKGVN